MDIYRRHAIVNVKRNGVEVSGIWPGWDTAIAIINHVHPNTRRKISFRWAEDEKKVIADRLGERIRSMRKDGRRAEAEEFYEVLDRFGLLPSGLQTDMGLPAFTDVTSGEELVFHLQAEALHRWSGSGMIGCGPYRLMKSFLDEPRRKEMRKMQREVRNYARQIEE